MEANKLTCCDIMVDDLVMVKGQAVKVYRIMPDCDRFGDGNVTDDVHVQYPNGIIKVITINDISPIPLTAEILEKNEFKYNDCPIVLGWEQYGLTLYKGGDGFLINCGQNVALIINYVHELQHALRLCGINGKEIVL